MDTGGITGTLMITLVILVVIFLIFREVVCWYWKINQSLGLLTEIRDLLAAAKSVANSPLSASSSGGAASNSEASPAAVASAAATTARNEAAARRLAQRVHDDPRLPIDEKIELLERLGGTFSWEKGSSCKVVYKGQEKVFPGGKEFGEWLLSNIVPGVLRGADA